MANSLAVDTENKLAVNGVDLLNRHQLSPSQDRTLQRYIDEHAHLLSWKDREVPEGPPPKLPARSRYADVRGNVGGGGNYKYNTWDNYPNAGDQRRHISRSVSPEKKQHTNGFGRSDSQSPYSTLPRDDYYGSYPRGTGGSSGYGTGGRNQLNSPNADSLKRKGVSWSDLVGADESNNHRRRSHTPTDEYSRFPRTSMSHYGSAGNVSREYNMSPAYSSLGKSRDNYNRFETEQHRRMAAQRKADEESKFSGFGDRPGSGVELTPHFWQGGEILTEDKGLPRGPKPRRLYYSPIGDGTVAADGIELKRKPADLTPRVTVTQLTHVDRGERGKDGLSIYEKTWNSGPSGPASEGGYGSEFGGPGSGRGLGAMSPDKGLGDGDGGAPPRPPLPADPFGAGAGAGAGNRGGSPYDGGNRGNGYGDGGAPDNTGRMSTASSMFSDPGYRYTDIKHGYAITNPRELIHQYATTTPIAVMDLGDNIPGATTTATYRKKVNTRIEEREFAPYPPYRATGSNTTVSTTFQSGGPGGAAIAPNKFVKNLRDENLTISQREANTRIDPLNQKDPNQAQKVTEIRQKTAGVRGGHDEIDNLTDKLMQGLSTTNGARY